jgi:hypothetical protein
MEGTYVSAIAAESIAIALVVTVARMGFKRNSWLLRPIGRVAANRDAKRWLAIASGSWQAIL